MSRVLRRPMFRMGGPVDSYNTGIVSGLDDEGYADGGRVGFSNGGFDYFRDTGFGRTLPTIYEKGIKTPAAALYNLIGVPINLTTEFFTGYNPGLSGERFFNLKDKPEDTAELLFGKFKAKPGMTYVNKNIGEREKYGTFGSETAQEIKNFQDSYKKPKDDTPPPGKDKTIDETELNLKNIERYGEAYRKMLGYDEAKSQSVFDALLAASPAFFQGRNLREAAPQVLKAVSESKAFEQPRNIKQAAAKLAIERESLMSAQRAKGEGEISKIEESLKKEKGLSSLKNLMSQYGSPLTYAGTKSSLEKSGVIPPNITVGRLYKTTDNEYFVLEGGDKKTPKMIRFYST